MEMSRLHIAHPHELVVKLRWTDIEIEIKRNDEEEDDETSVLAIDDFHAQKVAYFY